MHCSINKDSGDRAPVTRAICILQLPLAPPAERDGFMNVYERFFSLNYVCKSGEIGEERDHMNVLQYN